MRRWQQMEQYMTRYEKLDEAVLKRIALVTMLVDHTALCLLWQTHGTSGFGLALETEGLSVLYSVMRGIGRTAFPIFAFGIAEGCRHTGNPGRYLKRLLILALVSQLPFLLVCLPSLGAGRNFHQLYRDAGEGHFRLAGRALSDGWKIMTGQSRAGRAGLRLNTVFTLLCGALGCLMVRQLFPQYSMTQGQKGTKGTDPQQTEHTEGTGIRTAAGSGAGRWLRRVLCAAFVLLLFVLAQVLDMDYGWSGVALILLLYLSGTHRLLSGGAGWLMLSLVNPSELYSLGGFILIQCYNGKRGKQSPLLFYYFYPAHLLVLFLIRFLAAGY